MVVQILFNACIVRKSATFIIAELKSYICCVFLYCAAVLIIMFVWMKSSVQLGILCSSQNEPRHDKINKMSTPSEDSDQLRQPPSLIGVFSVRMKKPWDLSYPLSAHVGDCKLVSRTIKPKHSQLLCDDNVKAPPTSTFHRGLSYHAYPSILHLLQAQHAQILGLARRPGAAGRYPAPWSDMIVSLRWWCFHNWATLWENLSMHPCSQRLCCSRLSIFEPPPDKKQTSAQSDQSLRCALTG